MRRLTRIYSGLGRLRLLRSTVRLGAAGSLVLSIALWTLLAAFLLDFWLRMDRVERAVVLAVALGVVCWAVIHYLVPALRVAESDTLLAVMVDRQQRMHSDLVAAIQFEDPKRRQFGSGDLREAVIESAGEAAGVLNFLEGVSGRKLIWRLPAFGFTVLIWLAMGVWLSGHTSAFFNRLFLGRAHYPTRTIIEEIVSPRDDRAAYGRPVVFAVRVGGERPLPESGRVKVETLASGLETAVELLPDEKSPELYTGTLNRVLDDLTYTVYVGDARTEPRRLTLIPLPLAQFEMKVITPEYARVRAKPPTGPRSSRQVVVLEGSRVIPIVTADKELVSAALTFEKTKQKVPMAHRDNAFVLDSAQGPLARVTEPVHFHIHIIDRDGLSPENPIRGVVQVSADLPPRVALGAFSQLVVPHATPELRFKAIDDYALQRLVLHQTVLHADGNEAHPDPVTFQVAGHEAQYAGVYTLRLGELKAKGTPIKVEKGDQVVVAVEAIDYRGRAEGKAKRSEKWVFDVTDQAGILRGMARLNEQMDKKLDEVLRAQLEVGALP